MACYCLIQNFYIESQLDEFAIRYGSETAERIAAVFNIAFPVGGFLTVGTPHRGSHLDPTPPRWPIRTTSLSTSNRIPILPRIATHAKPIKSRSRPIPTLTNSSPLLVNAVWPHLHLRRQAFPASLLMRRFGSDPHIYWAIVFSLSLLFGVLSLVPSPSTQILASLIFGPIRCLQFTCYFQFLGDGGRYSSDITGRVIGYNMVAIGCIGDAGERGRGHAEGMGLNSTRLWDVGCMDAPSLLCKHCPTMHRHTVCHPSPTPRSLVLRPSLAHPKHQSPSTAPSLLQYPRTSRPIGDLGRHGLPAPSVLAPPDPAGPPVLTYLATMDSWGGDKGGRYFAIKLGLLLALAPCAALPVKLWHEPSANGLPCVRYTAVAHELHEITEM